MKKLFTSLSFVLITAAAFAQNVTGDWYGLLSVPGARLHVVMHLAKTGSGYSATMDSPDQKVMGLPMNEVTFADNKLMMSFTAGNLKYTGTFLPDSNRINGSLAQGGGNFPLNLTREKLVEVRGQDPKDFPYLQEEVEFTNLKAANKLSGTLTLPSNGKAKKIVVLITGSGPQNRNEEFQQLNHRPFLVISDWLTRNGIAVLRYDDRGVAKSTGNFGTATTADFADDVDAAVNYIKSRPDLKGLSVGLIGHSEGGLIAPMVATRNKNVNFIVLLAGPGAPIDKLMIRQSEDMARSTGSPDSIVMGEVKGNQQLYEMVKTHKELSDAALKIKLDSLLYLQYTTFRKATIGNVAVDKVIAPTSATLLSPWFRYFLGINPEVYLSKVKCPVLALNGTLDQQVSAELNLAAIKAALTKAGNKHFEIVPMPGLNHLFQTAVTGGIAEYEAIPETISAAVLTKMATWINAQ
jgi:alpha-beta hydrolase superfamily lysophospholipase